jgi:hypothetical protein
MLTDVFLLFMIIHILGDYYFQGEKLAVEKNKKFRFLLIHGLKYFLVAQIVIIPVWSFKLVLGVTCISLIHFHIDIIKHIVYKTASGEKQSKISKFLKAKIKNGYVYIADQVLHITTILCLGYIFNSVDIKSVIPGIINPGHETVNTILRLILMFLLIINPVNITFKKLFSKFRPFLSKSDDKSKTNNGEMIGNFERMLVLILLIMNQFTAIGLVFTAKSISRYDRISKDKEFAEYYLLGTLYSLLITIIIYLVFYRL